MKPSNAKKIKAFSVHLAASAFIASIAWSVVAIFWYPTPLMESIGVTRILLIMLACDVIIGPLLTLLVFAPNKPSLKFDLGVIVILQVSALIYGIWTVAIARPAWIVFSNDHFFVTQAHDLIIKPEEKVEGIYQNAPWLGPKYVVVLLGDTASQIEASVDAVLSGIHVSQRPALYHPISSGIEPLKKAMKPLSSLSGDAAQLALIADQHPDAKCWIPAVARLKNLAVIVNCSTASPVGMVAISTTSP